MLCLYSVLKCGGTPHPRSFLIDQTPIGFLKRIIFMPRSWSTQIWVPILIALLYLCAHCRGKFQDNPLHPKVATTTADANTTDATANAAFTITTILQLPSPLPPAPDSIRQMKRKELVSSKATKHTNNMRNKCNNQTTTANTTATNTTTATTTTPIKVFCSRSKTMTGPNLNPKSHLITF